MKQSFPPIAKYQMEIWKYPVTFLLMNISFGSIVLLVSSLHLRRHQKLSFLRQLFVRLSQLLPLLLLPLLMPHHLETRLVQQKIWMRPQPKTLILGWYRALFWLKRDVWCFSKANHPWRASTEDKVWCIFSWHPLYSTRPFLESCEEGWNWPFQAWAPHCVASRTGWLFCQLQINKHCTMP